MYQVTVIYNDYQKYHVDVTEREFESFIKSITIRKVYFDEANGVGFWLPTENVRAIVINRKIEESQKCQESQNSEPEHGSQV